MYLSRENTCCEFCSNDETNLNLFLFVYRAREVKDHTFFKDLDWKLVELLKVRGLIV